MNRIRRELKQFRKEGWINSSEKISVYEPKERFRKKARWGRNGDASKETR